LIAFLIIVAMPFAAFADPVGRQSGGGSTMDWQLNATGHEKATLRWVGPDGEVGSLDFPNGKNITLRLQDLGTELQNGQYSWELRLSPKVSKDVAKKLEAARAANDDKAAKKIMKDAGFNPDAMVMSGAFRVENGMFVSTDGSEGGNAARPGNVSTNALSGRPNGPIAANDQVIPDDLIVQGSACVGFDCVNNESFGFDTIRLKENSTRIKFEDTSVGSFPSNDWQLTANDSASGGANKFSIEDITGSKVPVTVTAGASTNSIFVDSTGRVGFRTSTPVLDLHVATSNTPAIRLEQNSSGGFTAQTWDVAGNEANFFVRDVTGGSRLPFRIRPGAPTSSIDISADGDVGIGTASPNANANVDVSSGDQLKARIALTGQEYLQAANTSTDGVAVLLGVNRTNNRQLWIGDTAALTQNSTNRVIRVFPFTGDISAVGTDGTTTKTLTLNSTGGFVGIATPGPSFPLQVGDAGSSDGNGAHVTTGGVWTDGSSREFKQDIMELRAEDAKAAVAALRPVTYRYKRELDEQYVGFIAEDVPDLVAVNNRHYLAPMDIVATLTKVVQEQQKTIDDLSKKVEALQQKQQ
jgi:hypothetical protein